MASNLELQEAEDAIDRHREHIAELEAEVERLTKERDEAERLKINWFETHLAHQEANQALGKANSELLKRAMDAERRAEALSHTGAMKVDRQRLNMEISKWATDSDLHITFGDVEALHEAILSALEPAAPEGFAYRDENGQPQVQICKCDPAFHEYYEDGVKHCRSCDAEWHPPLQAAPEGQQPVALTYGQKLIAEAISSHFGERGENYDECEHEGDTTVDGVWDAFDAFDALTRPAEQAVTEAQIEAVARVIELAIMRHGVSELELQGTLDDAKDALTAAQEASR